MQIWEFRWPAKIDKEVKDYLSHLADKENLDEKLVMLGYVKPSHSLIKPSHPHHFLVKYKCKGNKCWTKEVLELLQNQ